MFTELQNTDTPESTTPMPPKRLLPSEILRRRARASDSGHVMIDPVIFGTETENEVPSDSKTNMGKIAYKLK